jgi:acetyltransferase-like isoleucine patch superfamily enzyme
MYKIHVIVSQGEDVPYIDTKKELLSFSTVYDHTFRKFDDAAFALNLDCQILHEATFELEGASQEISADVDDIIIFASPFAFLAPAHDIENALSYAISSELGYATVGSMRSLYAVIGSGKMLIDGSTLNSPYDFISSISVCGAKCTVSPFCEGEGALCHDREEYDNRVKRYKHEFFNYLEKRGIKIENPGSVVVSPNTEIGKDTTLLPNTKVCAGAKIGKRCVIGPSTVISDSSIGNDCSINSSHIYRSFVESEAEIGPFAYIDDSTRMLHKVKIGAFTEVRRSIIGAFSDVASHCHIAHCETSPHVTIGNHVCCANYDGRKNNAVKIHEGAFIGSGTILVAPVTVGQGAFTAAGSTITDNVPAGALGIAREYQSNHDGWARRRSKA